MKISKNKLQNHFFKKKCTTTLISEYLLRKFVKILEDEKDIKGIQQYKNLLGEDVVSFWIDNIQYLSLNILALQK